MKNVVIVIPCRSGSKRIPDKNFQKVGGRSLIKRAASVALSIAPTVGDYEIAKQVIVASDSENHERVVSELAGLSGPLTVRQRTCEPDGPSVDVVEDALKMIKPEWVDVVCLVQCTSPFLRPKDIEGCIMMSLHTDWRGVVFTATVQKMTLPHETDATFRDTIRNKVYTVESGGCYASPDAPKLQDTRGQIAYTVDPMRALEIDEPYQLELANIIAEAKGW